MTTDFNLYLGKKASEGKITQDTFSGGIKKEQIKSKEMLSIFNAIDDGDGILDKKEAEKLKGLIVAAAKDDNLSEAEALEFLNKNNIKNATAKDLFNFLNTLTEAGKKIYASNEKTADTNNKAELDANKAKQQEAASIASDFYGACAQMKFRALDGEYFKSVLHRITDENASRVISQYNAQHPEETIVELICNEKTSSSDARKEALTHIINKLADEARSKGVPEADVQKLQDEFMVSMNAEFKKIGIIDPKKMEACLKSLHGLVLGASIEKTDISEEEARESVTGAAQEEYTNAKDQYDTARKEEGWLAKSGDTILGWFGCTTSADMDKKLEAYKTDIQRLQNCKTDAEFNKVYEEVFGIPFDSKKVAAYEAAKADYMTAYGAKAGVEKFDELATKADGLDYEAYRATVAEAIPQFSEEELDQIVNSLYEQLKESNPDVDKKTALKYYVDLCKQQQQALYDEVSQGRSLEQMSSEVDAVLQGAFGTRDIVNDVIKYNQNQQLTEMAAEMTAEIAATAVLQVIPGVGQLAAAKLAVSASKWAGKGIKIAKYAKKAESALNKVNTAMNANKAAKVASNAGAAFTGTTAVDFSNGKSVKDALKKGLQNAAFAGGGAFATEFAAVLSKTYGLTNEVAKKLAEEITERTLDVMASAGISAALIGEYTSTDAFMDIAVGVIMGQLGKKGLKNPAKTGSPEASGKSADVSTSEAKSGAEQTPKVDNTTKTEVRQPENEVSTPAKEEVPKAAEPPKNETVEESVTVDKAENSAGDEVEVLAVESGSVYGSKLSAREVQDIESLISDRMTKAKTAEQINEINALLAALPDSPNKTKFREDFDNLVKTLDPAEVQKAAKMHEANFERLKAANRSLDVNGINSLLSQIERRPEIAEQLMDIATNGKRYDFEMPEIIKIANKNNIDDLVKICQNPSLRLHYNSDGKVVGNDFSTVLKIANSFPDIKSQVLDVASKSNRPQHEIYAIADMMEAYPDSVDDIARLTISNANIKVGYDINNNPQYDVYKIISLAYRNQEYEKDILDYMAVQRRANNDTTDVCELMDFHLDTLKTFPEQRDVIAALSKDPNLDAVSIRYLVQSYRHDPAKLQDIIKLSAKKYDENTINRMMNSFEKNPNLRNIYLSDSPEFTLIDKNPDAAPVEVIEKRFAVRDKVEKSAPEELKKLQTTLGDEYFAKVKWEDIIPENASPEEVKEILSNLNEVSKFFARTSVNERNYGKNIQWAHQMNQISEAAAERIRSNASFDDVIQNIAQDYRSFDVSTTLDSNVEVSDRRKFSGVYRGYNNDGGATTPFDQNGSYSEYYDRFDKMLDDADFKGIKRPKPYEDVELTNFIYCQRGKCMYHPKSATVEPAMNHMRERYNELAPLFEKVKNGGTLTDAEKAMANDKIAEIYYLMANVMPWARGSNGISDIFMRSMYKSLGIDQPALKQGVSLDLEAFCVPLEEYKANWKTFFEQAA